jgi:cell division septal protein FtsQ
MRKPKLLNLLKAIAVTLALILVLVFVSGYLLQLIKNLDYFKVKDIIVSKEGFIDLSYLKGHNIFAIDLQRESRYISGQHPDYKYIRLIRVLPDRLFVEFIKRKPVAWIKLYRYFCVDEDSMLFDVSSRSETQDLPVILGLETKIFGPKSGVKYHSEELDLALDIIKEFRRSRVLRYFKLRQLDVAKPANVSLFLLVPVARQAVQPGLEVKIGQGQLKDNLVILGALLVQLKNDWHNIKYIDLRFKEPVIKLWDKEVKK